MAGVTRSSEGLIRQARLAEALTLAWMVVELFTALVVLRQLLLHTSRATDEELDARERQASRLVGWGLYGLIVYIVASSTWSLASGSRPESSRAGLALAIAALVIMPLFWRWRRALARRLQSPALRADAACSLVCIYMSALLLGGLLLNSLMGWWWADPVAALAMIWWIHGEAREALEVARSGRHCDSD